MQSGSRESKHVIRSLAVLLFAICVQAVQGQGLVFPERVHDFGDVRSENSEAVNMFLMINQTGGKVVIRSVEASCGCTVPKWTKDTLVQGDTAFIEVRFNPKDQIGRFQKSLTVYTSDDEVNGLEIRGIVLPPRKEKKPQNPGEPYIPLFEKYYVYDDKGVEDLDFGFKEFMDDLINVIQTVGTAEIQIESSASHVPTDAFPSNQALAESRAAGLKERIELKLKATGISLSKVKFREPQIAVQGPEYKNDFETNKKVYEKYQYVKAEVFIP
ncbi:MAG: DUF1573 domain-containing protein [Flavobacteriales bacterium]|nr:DUF1573 domain-containing protein [Flavobacteriales bacterium]MCB9448769.1 DUF1573 domain-containing protein [Flavobacteriales bacterium]